MESPTWVQLGLALGALALAIDRSRTLWDIAIAIKPSYVVLEGTRVPVLGQGPGRLSALDGIPWSSPPRTESALGIGAGKHAFRGGCRCWSCAAS